MFEVRLKPGHPTGVYHRGGHIFSASAPTRMEQINKEIAKDPWLIVNNLEPVKTPGDKGDKGGGKGGK